MMMKKRKNTTSTKRQPQQGRTSLNDKKKRSSRIIIISLFACAVGSLIGSNYFYRLSLASTTTLTKKEDVLRRDRFLDEKGTNTNIAVVTPARPVYGIRQLWEEEANGNNKHNHDNNKAIEVVYALPERNGKITNHNIRGVALLLHACTHNARKFFSPSSSCTECIGLSEEIRIVRLLLLRGYAVLAVSCSNKKSGCWSDNDISRIQTALDKFYDIILNNNSKNENKINTIAIGASSGGHFAASLAARGIASAAVIMVMSLGKALQNRLKTKVMIPPLYFAPMPRDIGTTRRVTQNYQELLVDTTKDRIVLDTTSCVSLPVTAQYLMERVPYMTTQHAQKIVSILIQANHIDSETNMLIIDPTKSNWRDLLLSTLSATNNENDNNDANGNISSCPTSSAILWETFCLAPGISTLAKALHRAWAYHEYCSEVIYPALNFIEQHQQ